MKYPNKWQSRGSQPHNKDKENSKPIEKPIEQQLVINESYGMIGRLPNFNRGKELRDIKKSNRYLTIQENRIKLAIERNEIKKAILIGLNLLRASKSYQLLLFNRVANKGYGEGSSRFAEETLEKTINKLRSGDMTLLIRRFYITKKNGKLRPIGAPNGESRIISKAITDLVYAVSEKDRSKEQHGYIKHRGTGSAILQIVEKLKEGYDGYEFDLKSFFNTVEPYIYFRKLEEKSKILAYLVSSMIRRIVYRVEELKPEAELHHKVGRKNTFVRTGVPQGLSLSPLLSTWALEYYGRPDNLVMYADDGIYFYKHNMNKFYSGMEKMGDAGIEIAPEKSKAIGKEFEFCGVKINRDKRTLSYKGSGVGWDSPELEAGVKTVGNKYGKERENGSGNIHRDSYISYRKIGLKGWKIIIIYYYGIIHAKGGHGYRKFIGIPGYHDILGSSSVCCNMLLNRIKMRKASFAQIKPFILNDKIAFDYGPIMKGRYKNYYNNGNSCGNPKEYIEIMEWHNLRRAKRKTIFE